MISIRKPSITPLHRTEDLVAGRHGRPLLPAWSQAFEAGDLWVLFGPNGSGKSTLLNTLAGLIRPVSGRHVIGDQSRSSGMLQTATISPLLPITVRNLVEGGHDTRWSILNPMIDKEGRRRANKWMDRLELSTLAKRSFHHLSGGQKQRAFLARTLVSEANVVLLDEPTSAMDRDCAAYSHELLAAYASEHRASVIVATHDLELALPFADYAIFVDQEAHALVSGTPNKLAADQAVRARYGNHISHILGSDP